MFVTLPVAKTHHFCGLLGRWRQLRRWPVLLVHLFKGLLLVRTLGRASDQRRLAKWQADLIRCCGIELVVKGRPMEETSLWAANHISWVDAPVLGSLASNVFVAKKELQNWPLLGDLVRSGGTLFIKRGANQANQIRDQMVEILQSGRNVVIFPEATTTAGGEVSYVFPRLLSASLIAAVPVQPVSIHYSLGDNGQNVAPYIDDMRFLPHLQGLLRQGKIICTVEFLAPLTDGSSRDGLANQLRQRIAHNLRLPASDNQKSDIDVPKLLRFLKARHGI